jgi:hypothetical protein
LIGFYNKQEEKNGTRDAKLVDLNELEKLPSVREFSFEENATSGLIVASEILK